MKFENNVFISRPVEKVFEFVTNLKNNAKWQTDILELEMTSEGPIGLGSSFRCVNRFMGKRIETEGMITEYTPGRTCCSRIISGTSIAESRFLFEAVNGGTRFAVMGNFDPGFFKLLKVIVKRKINQQLKNDMLKLKYVLENGNKA